MTMPQRSLEPTGTNDEFYDIVAVLYHALHGVENCQRYLDDVGDGQVRDFLEYALYNQAKIAEQGKRVLEDRFKTQERVASPVAELG